MEFADSRDNISRTTVRVDHRLTREDLTSALVAHYSDEAMLGRVIPTDLPVIDERAVREAAVSVLRWGGLDRLIAATERHDSADATDLIGAWATATVARLFPKA